MAWKQQALHYVCSLPVMKSFVESFSQKYVILFWFSNHFSGLADLGWFFSVTLFELFICCQKTSAIFKVSKNKTKMTYDLISMTLFQTLTNVNPEFIDLFWSEFPVWCSIKFRMQFPHYFRPKRQAWYCLIVSRHLSKLVESMAQYFKWEFCVFWGKNDNGTLKDINQQHWQIISTM